ncbi:PhoH family protein [Parendozoicomonas haliclonae]|uniref:PhoH-like protein n=1 Tax=Parendozoicomonas haliclonae TaxID=1960125 RepID=A0A1X7AFM3_9GAMM|nr:PhoH family protein [Parendozoicomonas haliclonae]SMA37039.1 PhoH-like protein [Parendozoicomonas haliclonae]
MHDAVTLEPIQSPRRTTYVLDSNVLIHDPNSPLNFEENKVIIPITVLEELDKLKNGKQTIAADCRQAIRLIDSIVGPATPEEMELGIPISRDEKLPPQGTLSIQMHSAPANVTTLTTDLNDNRIINDICHLKRENPDDDFVLVTKDINMRLKARGCGLMAEDYQSDRQIDDVSLLPKGFVELDGSLWDRLSDVQSTQLNGRTLHTIPRLEVFGHPGINEFIIDAQDFVGRVVETTNDTITLEHIDREKLLSRQAWGLQPYDIHQALALNLLLNPDIQLVNLNGPAGSGKTILALAAAIEMTVAEQHFRRIIVTRSTKGLDEDIGYLPGTEAEKMEPWLGAITDNLEALHSDDESTRSSVDYILDRVPIHFKSLNYIRGRSFQHSLIIIDECQNLTPHQMKTIITRAGHGSKVICLGNLAQIDTPYLNPASSGLTYLTQRFRDFEHGGMIQLEGVPRSALAAFAEANL